MSDVLIEAHDIGKMYRRRAMAGLSLPRLGRRPRSDEPPDEFWALKNIDLQLREGESLGIIGPNGAGKSTLLKILSRVTKPTTGRLTVRGRVGALIEVGAGFHPELSGRDNIFINGAILGMSRREIQRRFDEIVDFAELDDFIDTPVKKYSSGMYVRLGFAVAAHMEPDILITDEVLAVGDAKFQKKCLDSMAGVAASGRTIVFVSHNMTAVGNLCQQGMWIDQGKIVQRGAVSDVVAGYLGGSTPSSTERVWADPGTAPGNDKVRIHRVALRPEGNSSGGPITISTPVILEFEYWNLIPDAYLNLSLSVYDMRGTIAFSTTTANEPVWNGKPFPQGLFRSTCAIPGGLLNDETYSVTLMVVQDQAHLLYRLDNALILTAMDDTARAWHGKWPGVLRPDLRWQTELTPAEVPRS